MLIGVVAHIRREQLARKLIDELGADVFRFDYSFPSATACADNHIRVLKDLDRLATPSEWCIVLEDDAIPVNDFWNNAKRALLKSRSPLVGFYLGTGNPTGVTQLAIEPAVRAAEAAGSNWIVSDWFISTVGYAVRSVYLPDLITYLSRNEGPVDNRINRWTHGKGIKTWYTQPSLVDHDDSSSVISSFTPYPRHAHHFGTRGEWDSSTTTMDIYVEGWSPQHA